MPLISLELHNFRTYEHTHLVPDLQLNIIFGTNASGKTTLLEAVHLLGAGRSFRTAQIQQLHRLSEADLAVAGKIQDDGNEPVRLGLVHNAQGRRVSINGTEQKQISALAQLLPVQAISPDTHYEFQQSAKHRRGALDWGLFHVEPDFQELWAKYQRILQQRNAALKDLGQTKARYVWDEELVDTGEKLHSARIGHVEKLIPHYQACCRELLGQSHKINLILESGWDEKIGFGQNLRQDRSRDSAHGFTHSGPQRADFRITLNEKASKEEASHGQLKMLVIALRLAQIRNLIESNGQHCCLLIDDLAAELDPKHRARLTGILASLPIQVFVTATELSLIDRESWMSQKTFHVEQGVVMEQI